MASQLACVLSVPAILGALIKLARAIHSRWLPVPMLPIDAFSKFRSSPAPTPEYLEAYAEQDALAGKPNPRFKQSSLYCSKYLQVRLAQVGLEALTDAELDLSAF